MGFFGSETAAVMNSANAVGDRSRLGLSGLVQPRASAAEVFFFKALRDKNPLALRWMGMSEQSAKAAIEAYNPSFKGPQHINPAGGGMTTRNQATAPPRRRQASSNDTTMLTGQDTIGTSGLLGG